MKVIEYLISMTAGTRQNNGLYYHTSKYLLNDSSTAALFGTIPAVLFNPGDITYGTKNRPYYSNLSGNYSDAANGLNYDAYKSLTDGVSALYSYLPLRWNSTSPDERTGQPIFKDNLQQFLAYDYVGAADANSLSKEPLRSMIS
jgi:hypothetical protein